MTIRHIYNVTDENELVPVTDENKVLILIEYEVGDELIHTEEHPLCAVPGCPCGGVPAVEDEEVSV